jgi:DNA repair protein RadC
MLKITMDMAVRETRPGIKMTSPEKVFQHMEGIKNLVQETFCVISLDTKNRMVDTATVSIGTENSTLVTPSCAFRPAITKGSTAVLLVHNHPSGDPSPSAEDIRMTKQLVEAGSILGVEVLDHIIVGKEGYLSLREAGFVKFKGG